MADLAGLNQLAQLQLSYAPIKSEQLVHLKAFPNLRTI